MSLKKATTAFDEMIRVGGIGLSLFFMLQYLVFVNTKSLYYLNGGEGIMSLYFSIIGAMAYSTTTIVVMRRPGHKVFKVMLPLFDMVLVFCGYNMQLFNDAVEVDSNPMRVTLSVFIALFTGIITFGLGMLNFEERSAIAEGSDTDRIATDLLAKQDESTRINAELQTRLDESNRINAELNRNAEETSKKLNDTIALAEFLLPNHIGYESWKAKKKSVSNCNDYETTMIQLADKLKQGGKVSLPKFLELVPMGTN